MICLQCFPTLLFTVAILLALWRKCFANMHLRENRHIVRAGNTTPKWTKPHQRRSFISFCTVSVVTATVQQNARTLHRASPNKNFRHPLSFHGDACTHNFPELFMNSWFSCACASSPSAPPPSSASAAAIALVLTISLAPASRPPSTSRHSSVTRQPSSFRCCRPGVRSVVPKASRPDVFSGRSDFCERAFFFHTCQTAVMTLPTQALWGRPLNSTSL